MRSEALRNLRTLRQVRSSLDVTRNQRAKVTNGLFKTAQEIGFLDQLTDPRLHQLLDRERRRFLRQNETVNKSRQRVLKAREKLAMTVNKNRSLAELRRELQRSRWADSSPPGPPARKLAPEPNARPVELNY